MGLWNNLVWHYETKRTRLVYGWRVREMGHGVIIDRTSRVQPPGAVGIGAGSRIHGMVKITGTGKDGERVSIGNSCEIAEDAWLDSAGGFIEIGNNVYVGPHTYIGGHGGCKIGDDCQIAGFCYIIPANHEFDDLSTPIRLQGHAAKGITIEYDCWLGNGVSVLDGVRIGRGSVVAARAVVTRDVPECAIVAGIPASVVRYRGDVSASQGRGPAQ